MVYQEGSPAGTCPLRNAHLLGVDGSAMRAEIAFHDGLIQCVKHESGTAALVLQQPVGDCGELTIQTCLLPDRDEPYLLHLELARHRLMILYAKLEDWGMFEVGPDHPVSRRVELARKLFVEALCVQREDPAEANRFARDSLIAAIDGTEELALAHADLLLKRRKDTGMLPKHPIGCGIGSAQDRDRLRVGLHQNFDYLLLPMPWSFLAPEEGDYNWAGTDRWAEWAGKHRMHVVAGSLVSFRPQMLPNWLYIWEHDYQTVRDLVYEHIERVVTRYRNNVTVWNAVSGLHVNSHLTFGFDQLMDLTRMATMLVKKIQPSAQTLIEIEQPFGEYFSSNQRSIPPMTYADLVMQGAINFDGFSVKLLMGQATSGQYTRDLMQISHLLDQYALFGKPVYLTVAVPSEPVEPVIASPPGSTEPIDPKCGFWRRPWSPLVQSRWLEAIYQIAMSKPFVEAVAWSEIIDHQDLELPQSGLFTDQLQPKNAFRRLLAFRRRLMGENGLQAGSEAVEIPVAASPAEPQPAEGEERGGATKSDQSSVN